jgi:hypothetical protein
VLTKSTYSFARRASNLIAAVFLSLWTSFLFMLPAQADDAWWAQTNFENDIIYIKAPEGWEFYEIRGWYGSPTDDNCGADVTRLLTDDAKGKTEYIIYANNSTFGDPCGGVYKVFRFTWSIIPVQIVVPPIDPVDPTPTPEPTEEPTPEPTPEPTEEPTEEPTPTPTEEPTPTPTPTEEPTVEPTPEPPVKPEPPKPVVVPEPVVPEPEPEPLPPVVEPEVPAEIIKLTEDTNLEELPADTPILLDNGVVLTAQVVIAIQLLENPAELFNAIFTDPSQALLAISNIGADMSPEVRDKSEKVVVSAIIAGGIATQAAASAAATSTYRRKP